MFVLKPQQAGKPLPMTDPWDWIIYLHETWINMATMFDNLKFVGWIFPSHVKHPVFKGAFVLTLPETNSLQLKSNLTGDYETGRCDDCNCDLKRNLRKVPLPRRSMQLTKGLEISHTIHCDEPCIYYIPIFDWFFGDEILPYQFTIKRNNEM